MRRAPRPNQPYAGPTMPLPEEVFEALRQLAARNNVARSVADGRPTLADITEVLDYVRAALVAIPFDGSIVPDAECEVRWPDEMGLSETQGWLWCEFNWDVPLNDLDREAAERGQNYGPGIGFDDEPQDLTEAHLDVTLVWAGNDMINIQDRPPAGVTLLGGRLSLHVAIRPPRQYVRADEPATIQHRNVPRELWDAMMASGLWTYPTTKSGKLVTKRTSPYRGAKVLDGEWRFIGRPMPTVAPEDQSHWLPERFQDPGYKARRRATLRARRRETRVRQDFRVGDRVVYAPGPGSDVDAIPRSWRGVIVGHEPNIEPQHHYNVRWTTPRDVQGRVEQHEGLHHQSDLIDEAEAANDDMRGRGPR